MRAILLLLALGCATRAANSGTVTFKTFADAAARPVSFSVGQGYLAGSDLELREVDGCIRGAWGRLPINFCREDDGKGPAQRWAGASGEFSVVPGQGDVNVSGVLMLDAGRTVSMNQYVRTEEGPPWDELRRHPGLLAVAATVVDLQAVRIRH